MLEGNPTIRFYERTGAKHNGKIKEDVIGGQKVKELCYAWEDINNIGEYNWKPFSVKEVDQAMKGLACDWAIAGGWAIDLFLGKETREHEDIDIIVKRDDQLKLQEHLKEWDLWVADPPGTLRPWRQAEFIGKGLQDIWCRRTPQDPWQIQVMLIDVENGDWIFKRDESIRKNLQHVIVKSKGGLNILAPEIQLLYKSKSLREKDNADFENSLSIMSLEQKSWLKDKLIQVYKENHEWLKFI